MARCRWHDSLYAFSHVSPSASDIEKNTSHHRHGVVLICVPSSLKALYISDSIGGRGETRLIQQVARA